MTSIVARRATGRTAVLLGSIVAVLSFAGTAVAATPLTQVSQGGR